MLKDKCIICGDDSDYDFNAHVDTRLYYVEGAGQLCKFCWDSMGEPEDDKYLKIPKHFIIKYSNDQELGRKIREYFYKR